MPLKVLAIGLLVIFSCVSCATGHVKDKAGFGHVYNGTTYVAERMTCTAKTNVVLATITFPLNLID